MRELVARRQPLYRFVLGNVAARYDLDRADGRVDALREAARLVSSIRDRSKVDAFTRELSSIIGVDVDEARAEVRRASARGRPDDRRGSDRRGAGERGAGERGAPAQGEAATPRRELPNLRDPRFAIERETLKLVLQYPAAVGRVVGGVSPGDFSHPVYRHVWEAVLAAGGAAQGATDPGWATRLRAGVENPLVSSAISELGVEPVRSAGDPAESYVNAHVYRLLELSVLRRVGELKSRLQRTNPDEQAEEYQQMFGELVALEQHRRDLRDKAVGA